MDEKIQYRASLDRLPIVDPTPEDMATVCPHLSPEQAVAAFTSTERSSYLACPPLRVKQSFQIVSYRHAFNVSDGKHYPNELQWSYASRCGCTTEYRFAKEAVDFANVHWGADLIEDTWKAVVDFHVQDPTDLTTGVYSDYPRTKAVLYTALNRELGDIINDHSRPESELFDIAIAQMTTDLKVWHELKGNRGGYTEFNCYHCGAGLGLSSCTGCGHRFRDDHYRCGWQTPLSRKMVAFLRECGHEFAISPEVAWLKETQQYNNRITDRTRS